MMCNSRSEVVAVWARPFDTFSAKQMMCNSRSEVVAVWDRPFDTFSAKQTTTF